MGSKQSSMFVRAARNNIQHADAKLYDVLNLAKTNDEKQLFLESAIKILQDTINLLEGGGNFT